MLIIEDVSKNMPDIVLKLIPEYAIYHFPQELIFFAYPIPKLCRLIDFSSDERTYNKKRILGIKIRQPAINEMIAETRTAAAP